jgi:hypothetical protein
VPRVAEGTSVGLLAAHCVKGLAGGGADGGFDVVDGL